MRPVADWDESDLDELHRGEIMESLSLEYKDSPGVRADFVAKVFD